MYTALTVMPRSVLLSCEGITKSFGRAPLFEGLTFVLHEGDHVGLVGPNGAGKSTLLKILGGVETPDSGTCSRRKNVRIGYVPQTPVFAPGRSAAEIVAEAVADAHLDDHERDERVGRALGQAGFTDPGVTTDLLSGGWRARLAIARELARAPDVLLLDEPTNHLDVDSILWLESLLRDEASAFVVVSHDRYFLESVARRMLEISRLHDSGLFHVTGSYADFLEARDVALANQAAYRDTLAGLVRREVAWLRRGARARTSKSKARIASAGRSIEQLADSRARSVVSTVGIDFTSSGRKTKRLWSGEGLRIAFDGTTIVDRLDLLLRPGMRLGVLGPNGSGKTTLLRTIVGDIAPAAGTIRRAEGLRVAYFAQAREVLDPGLTLKRALAPEGDSVIYRDRALHVASWAKRFLFHPGQLENPVSRLSGGERARIILARMMLQPADLLVLDEPTNDLDIPALEVLEEALLEFPGALALVSHDRYLLDRVSTQVLALDGRGGAQHYADYDQWEANRPPQPSAKRGTGRASAPQSPRAVTRRLTYLEQREWDGMEAAVLAAESKLDEARRRAEDPAIATDAGLLQERHAEVAALGAEVDRLYARWAELDAKQKG
jgi:ATP-binding cassette subfamily F protein uup